METPSQDIKNKGEDLQEKSKVENEGGDEKEKIIEKENPSQYIKDKGDDAQEKPKEENDKDGDEKASPQDIKNKGDDVQEKSKVEHKEEKHEKVKRVPIHGGMKPAQGPKPPGKHDPPRMQTG